MDYSKTNFEELGKVLEKAALDMFNNIEDYKKMSWFNYENAFNKQEIEDGLRLDNAIGITCIRTMLPVISSLEKRILHLEGLLSQMIEADFVGDSDGVIHVQITTTKANPFGGDS